MRIVRDYQFTQAEDRGASAAVGNFDGVHIGHVSVIDLARAEAEKLGAPLGVVTFEPHPRQYFSPDSAPFRLMNPEAREFRLQKLNVDILYELNFNAALASLSPEDFASQVLVDGLGLRHVVVGRDFRFGQGRVGDVAMLADFGDRMGFGVTIAPLVTTGTKEVSSTAIRIALSQGRPEDAAAKLGHWHRMEGPVISGEQRGRVMGYPTANMSIDDLHPPKQGVYAVLVDVKTGPHKGSYFGAASLGVRPMFGENKPNLETFLFDFSGDLYGAELSVGLVSYLRPEVKFEGMDALIAQMDKDCVQARDILAKL